MIKNKLIIVILFALLASCKGDSSTPKPKAYGKINVPVYGYKEQLFDRFAFDCSELTTTQAVQGNGKGYWFDIVYHHFNATIYCTYLPITAQQLPQVLEDSYRLAYSHSSMAKAIEQQMFSNPEAKVSGIIYRIEGEVASPVHFFATDSVANFLRGSFYYSQQMKADSVAPITEFITKDIEQLMESLRWIPTQKK